MIITYRMGTVPTFIGTDLPNDVPGYVKFEKICVGKNGVHGFTKEGKDFFIPFDGVASDITIYE